MSTSKKPKLKTYVVTSNLGKLLRQRGLNQKELAQMTGISERAISLIKNRRIVRRIDCVAAARICAALSRCTRIRDGKRIQISLGELYPMTKVFAHITHLTV